MVKTIDVEKAQCFSPTDKEMILNDILEHHHTFNQFNEMLKVSSVKVYSRSPDLTSSTAASPAQPPFS
jgi:hypothetical protein